MNKLLVFSTERYDKLADEVTGHGGFERGTLERKTFPDGERYQRVTAECARRDAVIIGGTVTDSDTLEIFDLACGLVHDGVHTLTLVLPWFGYQTMERAAKPGEIAVAKHRAQLLSAIPKAGSGNRVVMVDLHTEGITQYFEGNIRPVHLSARPLVVQMIRSATTTGFVIGATDAGRAQWVEDLANDLGVGAAFVFKRRLSGNKTEVTSMAADVNGRDVVVYDDMIRTGGSLIAAAKAFKGAGANQIMAVCTHGVFAAGSAKRLQDSKLFSTILCTDTRPRVHELPKDGFIKVFSVANLIADHLSLYS